ncbi:MAG TPA: hypothetical protein VK009_16810 [Chloroflexota bacterium]|nr:hypothetical protein [Chloroflexota bacterium]
MTQHVHPCGPIRDIPNRPGMRGRNIMGSEHGVTSLFVGVRNELPETAHALTAGAWNRSTWFTEGTTYLEGVPRADR